MTASRARGPATPRPQPPAAPSGPIPPAALRRIGDLFQTRPWTFATTMPEHPHEDTRRRTWARDDDFARAVQAIRDRGCPERFGGRWCTPLNVNGHKHRTTGAPVAQTILINRKPLTPGVDPGTAHDEIAEEDDALDADPASLADGGVAAIARVRAKLHDLSPTRSQPVDHVRWVPIDLVPPNACNPNAVAKVEMRLLHTSITHDGDTQPIVTIRGPERSRSVVVDGFHRHRTMTANRDVRETTGGLRPIVVIDEAIGDRMAATVRHNRARGKHSVAGMASIVFQMPQNGRADDEIGNELGMQPEDLLRPEQVAGFSELFADVQYRKAWITERQARLAKLVREQESDAPPTLGNAP